MLGHVVGGSLWMGIDLFVGFLVGPILGRLSTPARFLPMMVIIMPTVATMTLDSGFQVARMPGNLASSSPNHAWLVVSFASLACWPRLPYAS